MEWKQLTCNELVLLNRRPDKGAYTRPLRIVGMVQWHASPPHLERSRVQRPPYVDPGLRSHVESYAFHLSESIFYMLWGGPCVAHGPTPQRASDSCCNYFYLVAFTVIHINCQLNPWWSRRHFETSWAPVPANKGVLERPRPPSSNWPEEAMSSRCLGFQNGHLVSSMDQRRWLRCCW